MGCKNSKAGAAPAPNDPAAKTATDPATTTEPHAPILIEATAEERALTQLKIVFDRIDAYDDQSVPKVDLASALGSETNLGALIKEAGWNEKFSVLEQLDTKVDGRVTWDEFQSNLKKALVAEVSETKGDDPVVLPVDEQALQQLKVIFESINADADCTVSKDELAAGLRKDEKVGKLVEDAGFKADFCQLEQLGTKYDRRITWDEFEAYLRSAAKIEAKGHGDVEAAVVLEDRTEAEGPVERKGWCC